MCLKYTKLENLWIYPFKNNKQRLNLNKKKKNLTSSGISVDSCSITIPKTFKLAKTLFRFTVFRSNLHSTAKNLNFKRHKHNRKKYSDNVD